MDMGIMLTVFVAVIVVMVMFVPRGCRRCKAAATCA